MEVVNISYAMIKLQFKLPQTLIRPPKDSIACPSFSAFLADDVKRKWKNVTDAYKKCLNHEKEITKSGSGYVKAPLHLGSIMNYIL